MKQYFNGNILDPIHGLIRLSDIEKWFLYQEQFSRLRNIRQNTFVYYVFPSANHSRFEHSIGVMHLATKILENTISNHHSGAYRKAKHEVNSNTKGFSFLNIDELYSDDAHLKQTHLQELRLAALMHDIGHGPFSHKFDSFTLSKRDFLKMVKESTETKTFFPQFDKLLANLDDNKKVDHEVVSCLYVLELVNALKKENDDLPNKFIGDLKLMVESINAQRIVRLIEPKLDFNGEGKMLAGEIDLTNLYSTIISSFPLDSDRMDYLLRDGTFSGVKYGVYDISRLLMSFIPIKIENEGYLSLKESGIDACVRFIESRAHLFNIVYGHKTNVSANTMLDFIFENFEESIIDAKTYQDFKDFYWINSDEYFLRTSIPAKLVKSFKNDDVKSTHRELMRRRLWKRIWQTKITIHRQQIDTEAEMNIKIDRIKAVESLINKKLQNHTGVNARCQNFKNVVFKDSDKSQLKIIKKGKNEFEIGNQWKEFNKELRSLNYVVIHCFVFMERKFKDSEEFQEKRNAVLELIKDELNELYTFANS